MSEAQVAAHFWTMRHGPEISDWDPDLEPDEHRSGYGHSFLELFVRLRRGGHPVTIGPSIPRGRSSVVVCLEELSEWHRQGVPRNTLTLCCRLLGKGRRPLVVVRNDVHPHIRSPICTSWEVMPTAASVVDTTRQTSLPLLPQRGLIPRDADRPPRILTLGIKAYRSNVPDWIDTIAARLRDDHIVLRVDDGEGRSWGDFREVDAVLCVQPPGQLGDPRRKPATKLINAWAAGSIPICEPHPAFAELATAGVDALLINDPSAIPSLLSMVNADPHWASRLFAASRGRGQSYAVDAVTRLWAQMLLSAPPMRRFSITSEIIASSAQLLFGPAIGRKVARALGAKV